MFKWEIVVNKNYSFENIKIVVNNEWFSYEPEIQSQIDKLWEEKVKESEEKWSKLWDWNNYRLVDYKIDDWILLLEVWFVKYRNIWASSIIIDQINNLSKKNRWNGMFVAWLIKSKDNYYILGERSWRYLRKEWELEVLGWVLQPDDIIVNTVWDIYSCLLKELKEEGWIDKIHIIDKKFLWIIRGTNLNFWLIFFIELNLNKEQIIEKFNESNDLEMKNLVFVNESEIEEFLNNESIKDWEIVNNLWLYSTLSKNIYK